MQTLIIIKIGFWLLIIINILAGGMGSRMGGNKPLSLYKDKPLIAHVIDNLKPQCDKIWVNIGDENSSIAQTLKKLDETKIADIDFPNLGPLSGVYSGLALAQNYSVAIYITAPCDMPNLPTDYVEKLVVKAKAHPDKIIYYKGTHDFPICALWPLSALESLKDCLKTAQNGAKVMGFINEYGAISVTIDKEVDFLNINNLDQI